MDDGVAIKDDAEFEADTLKVFNGKVAGTRQVEWIAAC